VDRISYKLQVTGFMGSPASEPMKPVTCNL
jgi:hypothetical protein